MLVNLPQMVTKDVLQARQKGPAMSHELHDYAEIYTPSREEPAAPWAGPQVIFAAKMSRLDERGSLLSGSGPLSFRVMIYGQF